MRRIVVVVEQPDSITVGRLQAIIGWLVSTFPGQTITVDSDTANVSTKGALLLRLGDGGDDDEP